MAGQGILSKGITLSYKKGAEFVVIPDIQEVPELGGTVEKIEVTTLADSSKRYINGIKDYGDLAFKFLYDNSSETASYRVLRGLEEAETIDEYKVTLPDETTFTFTAQVSTKIDSSTINGALTFTATLALNSDMEITNPA